MLFRKKGYLRREFDDQFLKTFLVLKQDYERQKDLADRSFDSEDITDIHLAITRAKYYFAIKEARRRNVQLIK